MRRMVRIIGFLVVNLFFLIIAILLAPVPLVCGRFVHRKIVIFLTRIWAQWNTHVLGITVRLINGELIQKGQNYFIIGNHLSYLDIILIGCKQPGLFVAKKEVKYWPLLGQLAWLAGSLFVDRSKKGPGVNRPYVGQIARYLRQGLTVTVFPEGTSSNGETVLPFKKTIFSSPILAETPILPVTIRYVSVNHEPFSPQNRDRVTWHSDMTFVDHFWGVLNLREFTVEIIINPPMLEKPEGENVFEQGKALSLRAHDVILQTYLQSSGLNPVNSEIKIE